MAGVRMSRSKNAFKAIGERAAKWSVLNHRIKVALRDVRSKRLRDHAKHKKELASASSRGENKLLDHRLAGHNERLALERKRRFKIVERREEDELREGHAMVQICRGDATECDVQLSSLDNLIEKQRKERSETEAMRQDLEAMDADFNKIRPMLCFRIRKQAESDEFERAVLALQFERRVSAVQPTHSREVNAVKVLMALTSPLRDLDPNKPLDYEAARISFSPWLDCRGAKFQKMLELLVDRLEVDDKAPPALIQCATERPSNTVTAVCRLILDKADRVGALAQRAALKDLLAIRMLPRLPLNDITYVTARRAKLTLASLLSRTVASLLDSHHSGFVECCCLSCFELDHFLSEWTPEAMYFARLKCPHLLPLLPPTYPTGSFLVAAAPVPARHNSRAEGGTNDCDNAGPWLETVTFSEKHKKPTSDLRTLRHQLKRMRRAEMRELRRDSALLSRVRTEAKVIRHADKRRERRCNLTWLRTQAQGGWQ